MSPKLSVVGTGAVPSFTSLVFVGSCSVLLILWGKSQEHTLVHLNTAILIFWKRGGNGNSNTK
jgi:hypothetical protein